ncbi:MAG: 4a-hydroxytetrahydrobiopterin dehydratase [Agrococcus sp.]
MSDPKARLTDSDIVDAELADWRRDDGTLVARFRSRSFAAGLDLVNRIGASAEAANHHPDITLTYGVVDVTLFSHDVGGITSRDIRLARAISAHAADLGIAAERESR